MCTTVSSFSSRLNEFIFFFPLPPDSAGGGLNNRVHVDGDDNNLFSNTVAGGGFNNVYADGDMNDIEYSAATLLRRGVSQLLCRRCRGWWRNQPSVCYR